MESDRIVIVCRDMDAQAIEIFTKQINWGKRVRGIVKESELIEWYERCLRGQFANHLAKSLLSQLVEGFNAEFPQAQNDAIPKFLQQRGYLAQPVDKYWLTETEIALNSKK